MENSVLDNPNIILAARILSGGGLVAFPTETVYGLGADATNPQAVARVFEVKQRPRFDPLIVHLASPDWLGRYVTSIPEEAETLARRFWPGPLTMVLPKRPVIPDLVTSGLSTVAIRVPAHPMACALIDAAGVPIAAPSANRFGRISPTTAEAVQAELGEQIDFILDGGPTEHGLESTVVAFDESAPRILRPGPITREMLEAVLGKVISVGRNAKETPTKIESPGQLEHHYAPKTPMRLVARARDFTPPPGQRVGLLLLQKLESFEGYEAVEVLSQRGDMREAAANLFAAMRRLDAAGLDWIVAEAVAEAGLGLAIMDRLKKASTA